VSNQKPLIKPFQKVLLARVEGWTKNPYVDLSKYFGIPVFFGAGPILGAPSWHRELFRELQRTVHSFILVLPLRVAADDELVPHHLIVDEGNVASFKRQLALERHYLKYCGEAFTKHPGGGAILFNLCCEDQHNPRTDGNPYAMDTRRELGEWCVHLAYGCATADSVRICIAADPTFPGLSAIRYCYDEAWLAKFPIQHSLRGLARAAAAAAKEAQQWQERRRQSA
jgi:hypothetical protein